MKTFARFGLCILASGLLWAADAKAVLVFHQTASGAVPAPGAPLSAPEHRAPNHPAPNHPASLLPHNVGPAGMTAHHGTRSAWGGSHTGYLAANPPPAGETAEPRQAPATEEAAPQIGEEKDDANGEESEEDDEDGFEEEFGDPSEKEVFDPLSGYNRAMTSFNDGLYVWVLDPVARGYRYVAPEFARRGIRHFFNNLLFPVRFINNTLQLKFKNAGEEFLRFCINTTLGILGFWDPAKEWFGLEAHPEDFGQTLGFYGVGSGFHIVLPFFGPSNLRDMFSMAPDYYLELTPDFFLNPENYPDSDIYKAIALKAFKDVNNTSLRIGEYENLKKDAIDLYPFLREVYEQNRNKQISE